MFVFLHEMLLKVPTPLIWSLKPYGLAVPSSLIQNSSLVLMSSMAWVKRCFSEKSKNLNKLLVFEALYPQPDKNADLANLN